MRSYLATAKLEIKWPNDIYANDRKIAGILIETTINGSMLESVFCGIGLNVNQSHFTLPTATSFEIESGQLHDRDTVLQTFLLRMEQAYRLNKDQWTVLFDQYQKHLRWRNEERTFLIGNAEKIGVIQGVDENGKLVLLLADGLHTFDIKELVFLH